MEGYKYSSSFRNRGTTSEGSTSFEFLGVQSPAYLPFFFCRDSSKYVGLLSAEVALDKTSSDKESQRSHDWSIPTLELRTKMLVSTHLKFLEPKGSSSSDYQILSKEKGERERDEEEEEDPSATNQYQGQMGSKGIKAWFLVPQISDVSSCAKAILRS